MRVEIVDVTPEVARSWLQLNTDNFRPVDKHRVKLYAEEMKNGKWVCNGETIKFCDGVLADGQHRLEAVALSGATVRFVVVHDMVGGGIGVDRGKQRTVSQWLNHKGVKNAKGVASAARFAVLHGKGKWAQPNIQIEDVSDSEIIEYATVHTESLVSAVLLANRIREILPVSITAAILQVGCCSCDPAECVEAVWFINALKTGDRLSETDAVLHLRNRLLQDTPQASMTHYMKRMLATIAWNKTLRGETCTSAGLRLRLSGPAKQKPPCAIEVVSQQYTG